MVASDGGLINEATPKLFISVTGNYQADMIGLFYEALAVLTCSLGKQKYLLLLVSRYLLQCQLHCFPPDFFNLFFFTRADFKGQL